MSDFNVDIKSIGFLMSVDLVGYNISSSLSFFTMQYLVKLDSLIHREVDVRRVEKLKRVL
jgi:hypothetical protein